MNAARSAWRILTWKHWTWATGLGVLLGVLVPLQNLHINFYYTPWKMLYNTPFFVVFAWIFLVAIAIVEASAPPPKWPSLWRYLGAGIVASILCVATSWVCAAYYPAAPKRVISGGSANTLKTFSREIVRTDLVFGLGFDGAVHGSIAMFIYAGLRNSRRAARALADAEIGRSEAQRNLVAAQLLAAHAQVDPAFVIAALDNIGCRYDEDPAKADMELDDLIAFLRAAIPRMRSVDGIAA
jgi:hypothetical protein